MASRKFRAILLHEWFRVFHVYELDDIRKLLGEIPGGIVSVDITSFVRSVSFFSATIFRLLSMIVKLPVY